MDWNPDAGMDAKDGMEWERMVQDLKGASSPDPINCLHKTQMARQIETTSTGSSSVLRDMCI